MLRDSHLQMLWTARVDYESGSGVNQHKHDQFYQVLLILSGKGKTVIDEKSYPLTKGQIYLFHRGILHQFSFTEPAITIDFKFRILNKEMEQMLRKKNMVGDCPADELEELKKWYQIARTVDHCSDQYKLSRIDAGFKSTFISLLAQFGESESSSHARYTTFENRQGLPLSLTPTQHPIVSYVEKYYAQKINLKQLANRFNYNPHYIIKIFQEQVGMSPIQYLQEIRIHHACYYLEYSSMSVSEIAQQIGMTPPYFSRLFHKRLGMSPSTYRDYLVDFIGKDIVFSDNFTNKWRIVKQE
ncbi:AraC family transcriptional regulator [Gracilibacillus salitolerans]|uniref:AraC family transcriptional regulator n=1 Tax=Gracilibacillus salitolerans TaxID=2663022 RepID=A0A5Q2TS36_9BACI|nr:AraC family transcriptional regulator [Gracilibacillus salitolerans]QGH35578.1 AraC family transcriptional regulator [Gracilibacillus salitolerans]